MLSLSDVSLNGKRRASLREIAAPDKGCAPLQDELGKNMECLGGFAKTVLS